MRLAYLLVALAACSKTPPEQRVRIAAAADLTKAFDEVGKAFATKTGIKAEVSYNSSGVLAKQIAQGAPYFLFAAANKDFVDQAVASGKCDAATVTQYAQGEVVVWTPDGIDPPKTLADLADARFSKIALANPETAPYGRAAKQALEHAGVWDQLKDKIVLADNVQATMLYARRKEAQAALVALSLAVVTDGGKALPVDKTLYDPLVQELVVCGTGTEAEHAKQFAAFVASPEGREIMTRYGFELPR
ncbi:MAG TPA: molybdate ABC transporter substrate-binding protein [Kofleriaceae bacterium]